MNRATRTVASILGVYAGLLGATHGFFATLHGNRAPGGIMINAIGAPCQPDAVWHACLPAMTLMPNLLASGIVAIIISLIALVWAAAFVQRTHGGLVLISLSILMLLVGGGFIPTFVGLIAGAAGARIHTPLSGRWTSLPDSAIRFLAKLWPWALMLFVTWFVGGWVLGYFFNQTMIDLSLILFFFFNLGLPLLTVFAGFAHDILSMGGISE